MVSAESSKVLHISLEQEPKHHPNINNISYIITYDGPIMSTKIYYARRVRADRLNYFLDDVRAQVQKMACRRILELMASVDIGDWKCPHTNNPWMAEQQRRFEKVCSKAEKASESPFRDPLFCLDASLNIWLYGDHAYIVPIMEDWMKRRIKWPKYSSEFGYWNNTDKPGRVSNAAWNKRRRTWEAINLGDGVSDYNARRVNHEIIDGKNHTDIFMLWHQYIQPNLRKTKLYKASAKEALEKKSLVATAEARQAVKLDALPGIAEAAQNLSAAFSDLPLEVMNRPPHETPLLAAATDGALDALGLQGAILGDPEPEWQWEKRGDGWALYQGRNSAHHGLNRISVENKDAFDHQGELVRARIAELLNAHGLHKATT